MATITSTTTGDYETGSTWVGGTAPISTDDVVIASGHTVTTTAAVTNVGANINSGGTLVIGADYTSNGSITLGGTVTQNAGTNVLFGGDYDVTCSGDNGRWDISGTSGSRCSFSADTGFGVRFIAALTLGARFTATYTDFTRLGRSTSIHSIDAPCHTKTGTFEFTNCKFDNYWRLRFGYGATPAVGSTWKFTNCDFRNPLATNIWEYTCTATFTEGTRGVWDSTFVGTSLNKDINISHATTDIVYVSGCIGEDMRVYNVGGGALSPDVVHRFVNYTGSDNDIFNDSTPGGWDVHDCIIESTRANAHMISSTGADPTSACTYRDNITFGANSADNHYGFTRAITIQNNISVGGNGIVSTSTNTSTVLIDRHTHINKAGNFDAALIFETNNFGPNCTFRNSLTIGINSGDYVINNLNVGAQTMAYVGYNCNYNNATVYNNLTITDDQTANDITSNPTLNDPTWTLATWDAANGGVGTVANAFAEMLKLNGHDRTGNTATFNTAYTKANALSAARTAFAPTNTDLQGAGLAGVDIGALDVIMTASKGSGYFVTFGTLGF